jgi:hypothetical protein
MILSEDDLQEILDAVKGLAVPPGTSPEGVLSTASEFIEAKVAEAIHARSKQAVDLASDMAALQDAVNASTLHDLGVL